MSETPRLTREDVVNTLKAAVMVTIRVGGPDGIPVSHTVSQDALSAALHYLTAEPPTCATCRYGEMVFRGSNPQGLQCTRPPLIGQRVSDNFGCTLHEPREEPTS